MGYIMIESKEVAEVIAGSFDIFYQEHFRKALDAKMRANEGGAFSAGLVKPADASRIRVVD
jgi:hypothetical protein